MKNPKAIVGSKRTRSPDSPRVGVQRLVRLLSPIRAAAGNVLLAAGAVVKVVGVSDSGDELCVEHTEDIGGWSGERNRRWVFKMHTEEANDRTDAQPTP